MAAHHARTAPVRQKLWDADLQAYVLRTIGHRATCACEWRGRLRVFPAQADADARKHNARPHE